MFRNVSVQIAVFVFGATIGLAAQDWVAQAPGGKQVLVDNAHFRLVEVTIPPGGTEPAHTHPEYLEYALAGGRLTVTYVGKPAEAWTPETGKAYYGAGEPPHTMKNVDSKPVRLLLLEMKDRPFAGVPGGTDR